MICGAISRSVAQTLTHPANTMKTLLQSNRAMGGERLTIKKLARPKNFRMLTRGAGAQLIMSIPHGAVNFAVLELVRKQLNNAVDRTPWAKEKMGKSSAFGPTLDFVSSAIATVCCSVVSTPQMMLMDNIMAGAYPNLGQAIIGLSKEKGIAGFYTGWWPGLAGKIPSYALTWTLFQQIKRAQLEIFQRPPKDIENSIMGCMASATSVCVMIPMDTIKTRLVTQSLYPDLVPYKGIWDAALRITKEEGIGAFYRGLPPRLISVVPMIGIQFGVYEFMKKVMVGRHNIQLPVVTPPRLPTLREKRREMEENERRKKEEDSKRLERLTEVIMEVSADDEQPFPVPKH
jgi:solute carrier family 25 S-adenosylmethionine transporter 26